MVDTGWKYGFASDGRVMTHLFPARTAGRIKWFGQLTAALDEAQYLLAELTVHGNDPSEALRARTLVLALSCEVELLRSEGFFGQQMIAPEPISPNWRGSAA